jgi:hypothetical protein
MTALSLVFDRRDGVVDITARGTRLPRLGRGFRCGGAERPAGQLVDSDLDTMDLDASRFQTGV